MSLDPILVISLSPASSLIKVKVGWGEVKANKRADNSWGKQDWKPSFYHMYNENPSKGFQKNEMILTLSFYLPFPVATNFQVIFTRKKNVSRFWTFTLVVMICVWRSIVSSSESSTDGSLVKCCLETAKISSFLPVFMSVPPVLMGLCVWCSDSGPHTWPVSALPLNYMYLEKSFYLGWFSQNWSFTQRKTQSSLLFY